MGSGAGIEPPVLWLKDDGSPLGPGGPVYSDHPPEERYRLTWPLRSLLKLLCRFGCERFYCYKT